MHEYTYVYKHIGNLQNDAPTSITALLEELQKLLYPISHTIWHATKLTNIPVLPELPLYN